MTEPQKKCPACSQDLVVEERCTFHGDWYCVCAECDALIDFDEPSADALDVETD
jgi:hypothetical protein